jgi:ABC-type transporter Mla maintaining outer membrane lipid asymmetry ATPase subunit MlaF
MPSLSLHNPGSGGRCEIELERGLTYAIEAGHSEELESLLEQLLHHPATQIADSVGGTISSINVMENIGLPAIYHRVSPILALEREALDVLAACGLDHAQAEALCRKRPAELRPFDKRLVGFVRALLMQPDLLVYNRFLEGLTRAEMERAAALNGVYRARQPAGTAVYLQLTDMPVLAPACDRSFMT